MGCDYYTYIFIGAAVSIQDLTNVREVVDPKACFHENAPKGARFCPTCGAYANTPPATHVETTWKPQVAPFACYDHEESWVEQTFHVDNFTLRGLQLQRSSEEFGTSALGVQVGESLSCERTPWMAEMGMRELDIMFSSVKEALAKMGISKPVRLFVHQYASV